MEIIRVNKHWGISNIPAGEWGHWEAQELDGTEERPHIVPLTKQAAFVLGLALFAGTTYCPGKIKGGVGIHGKVAFRCKPFVTEEQLRLSAADLLTYVKE